MEHALAEAVAGLGGAFGQGQRAPKVAIAGAGPAGIISAATFARLGYEVDVYEKRTRPDPNEKQHHSFTMVLNPKGLGAIRSVGIGIERINTFPLLACVRHSPINQSPNTFLQPKHGAACNFERHELVQWLLAEVQRMHPKIRWHFDCALVDVDVQQRQVLLLEDGQPRKAGYDLLLGADGANSVVRAALQASVDGFDCDRKEAFLVYKRFDKFPWDSSKVLDLGKYPREGSVIHFYGVHLKPTVGAARGWFGRQRRERANWGFVTLVNHEDGTLSGGLSVHREAQELLDSQEDYEDALKVLPLPPDVRVQLATTLRAAPWSWGGAWVRCNALHAPGVVLLGDAGHSVSPSMGQGCNAALEDITVLQRLLAQLHGIPVGTGEELGLTATPTASRAASVSGAQRKRRIWSLDDLPAEFTRVRKADVHALVWLDEHAREFRGQLGYANRYFWMYMAHMYCRASLHKLAPSLVTKPCLMLLWESPTPYTAVVNQMHHDLYTLAAGAALGVAAAGLAAFKVLPHLLGSSSSSKS